MMGGVERGGGGGLLGVACYLESMEEVKMRRLRERGIEKGGKGGQWKELKFGELGEGSWLLCCFGFDGSETERRQGRCCVSFQ